MELRLASRTSGREARHFLLLIALPHPKMGQRKGWGVVQGKARYRHVGVVSRRQGSD